MSEQPAVIDVEDQGPIYFLLAENVRRYQQYRIDGLTKTEREHVKALVDADNGAELIRLFVRWRDGQLGLEVQDSGETDYSELDTPATDANLLHLTNDQGDYLWEP